MIKIENLVKRYGANYALDDISFTVNEGEIVGFLGPNGAGKTTTMNIITGYLSSTSGSVTVNGIDILEEPKKAKKLIGFLPEQPPLYLDMTVEEYLNFVYNLKGCTLNRYKHLSEICEVVKISDVFHRLIKNLSKGYRQRVGIAQALVGNPKIIIFDEPTVGLDPKQIIEIRNLIRTLGKDHTVILSTHILPEVQAVCDRIIIINNGKIIADQKTEEISKAVQNNRRFNVKICGPKKEVLSMLKSKVGIVYAEELAEKDGDAFTYMIESEPGVDIRKNLFYTLAEKGWPLIGLEGVGTNLEDIFISIVDGGGEDTRRKKGPPSKQAAKQEDETSAIGGENK
ncbi:MAG: ATP-binding cassette domain-containing protein [Clostridia bacterium]|nr:ATP-binding cassette domain-containing protein [Clostridia bacterium]